MHYEIALASDTGKIKPVNEDRGFYRIDINEEGIPIVFCAVADGMGGLDAGERASQIAIDYLIQWWEERKSRPYLEATHMESMTLTLDENPRMRSSTLMKKVTQELEQVFLQINDALLHEGAQYSKRIGTTLSVLFLYGHDYILKHIGDSRIYKVSHQVELLTEDHSWVAQQVQQGRISDEDAKHHPSRHILTQCLGVTDKIMPFVGYGSLQVNELIIVCSDGFYTMVEEEQWFRYCLESQKESQDLRKTADTLLSFANQNGGHDNITLVLVKGEGNKKGIIGRWVSWFRK